MNIYYEYLNLPCPVVFLLHAFLRCAYFCMLQFFPFSPIIVMILEVCYICLLVFTSPNALVHPNTLSSTTSHSLSSVLSLYVLVFGKVDGTVGIPFKKIYEISKHLFEWLYLWNRCNLFHIHLTFFPAVSSSTDIDVAHWIFLICRSCLTTIIVEITFANSRWLNTCI